jgi:FSR family fosmidomycin resistance protein-like MFS transporter
VLADVWRRRAIILGGGVLFTLALVLTAAGGSFAALLAALVLFNPASGAFVSLSQAALMDSAPERHEQNMARWALAGSIGQVMGPFALGAALALGLGWRGLFAALAIPALLLLAAAWRLPIPTPQPDPDGDGGGLVSGARQALRALKRRDVVRWLVLLECSDLMLDVLYGVLALYFVDVVGVDYAQAGLAVAVWTGVGLLGDLLLIPLLERVRGLAYLRCSVAAVLLLYPAFLLLPAVGAKFVLLGMLGVLNAGWYSILKGQLYTAMRGQSGTALAASNVAGLAGGLVPLGLGLLAEQFGLAAAMWLLLAGPLALLVGIPRGTRSASDR